LLTDRGSYFPKRGTVGVKKIVGKKNTSCIREVRSDHPSGVESVIKRQTSAARQKSKNALLEGRGLAHHRRFWKSKKKKKGALGRG